MLYQIISIFLSICLIVEYPTLAYTTQNATDQGIQSANQAISNAGQIMSNIGNAINAGNSTVNIPGMSNSSIQIPMQTEIQNFNQQMSTNAQDWTTGNYNPVDAGNNAAQAYVNNPASPQDFNANATNEEKSGWGNNIGYNSISNSFNNQPYDASTYANNNYIWQSYYDLWQGNNTYVNDLTVNLDCKETVTTHCEDQDVQDCTEDACIGFLSNNAASCAVYYDDNGNLVDECSSYENNPGCFLTSEECIGSDEWSCSNLPCWNSGSCSVPSGNGGNIDTCCAAMRVYTCIDCSKTGGIPDPDWSQCPGDWQAHGKCAACLVDQRDPQPVVTFSSSRPDSTTISFDNATKKYHIYINNHWLNSTVSLDIDTVNSNYITSAYIDNISSEDSGHISVEGNILTCVPQDCSCGEQGWDGKTNDNDVSFQSYLNDGHTRVDVKDCGGGDRSWTRTNIYIGISQQYYCDPGYTFNSNTGKCELHEKATIIDGGTLRNDDCKRFQDNPDCTLVSSQCVTDENGNPVVDDNGNCYLYEYRYKCCNNIGITQKCTTSSDLQCGGLSCIGDTCRTEFPQTNTDPENATKISWFMNNAPFSEGEHKECVKKSLSIGVASAKVDCCDLADQMAVGPLTYFQLASSGVRLYKTTKSFLEKTPIKTTDELADFSQKACTVNHNNYYGYMDYSDIVGTSPQDVCTAKDAVTKATPYSRYMSFISQAMHVLDVASFVANPDPMQLLTDQYLRDLFADAAKKSLVTAANNLLGHDAATSISNFFNSAAMANLGQVLNAVGWAILVYQITQLILSLIVGGCSQDDMELAVKKKMGLCHYIGSYKKGGGLFSIKKVYRVYCCYKSPDIRIMMEQIREQIGGWGTPHNPNCSEFTADDLNKIDWSQIKMDQIEAYKQQAGDITIPQIIQEGQNGGYRTQYIPGSDFNSTDIPQDSYTRRFETINEAGKRTYDDLQTLQQNGFANPH